jgi:UDP-N-acetyl-D-galactosamine dehydrogenase
LAALFARKFKVIGFDINAQRITELEGGLDRTRELSPEQLVSVIHPPSAALGFSGNFN